MKNFLFVFTTLTAAAVFSGCSQIVSPAPAEPESVIINRTELPIKVDGYLNEAAWKDAVCYPLIKHVNWKGAPEKTKQRIMQDPLQKGSFRLLYDDKYLYFGVEFEDSDVIAESAKNQSRLYRTGDLAELFLSPADGHAYFEIYINPAGAYTFYVFPGGGVAKLPSMFDENRQFPNIKAAARVYGTLNNSRDKDTGWHGEIAVPLKELSAFGTDFVPGTQWRTLAARYNYAVHLRRLQFSGVPFIPAEADYGEVEYHAPLQINPVQKKAAK